MLDDERGAYGHFSNFGSLKSTETSELLRRAEGGWDFSNFGSLKSTETLRSENPAVRRRPDFSNFGSLKSTETRYPDLVGMARELFQQFRLVEEH